MFDITTTKGTLKRKLYWFFLCDRERWRQRGMIHLVN